MFCCFCDGSEHNTHQPMLLTNHGTVKLLSKQQVINYRAKKSRFFCETAPTNHNKQYSISISLSWQPAIKLCRIFWFLFLCLMSGPWRIFIFPLKGSETVLQVVAKRVEGIEYKLSINLPLWKHHLLSLWWTSRKFFSCISNRLALFRQSATTASINTHTRDTYWPWKGVEMDRNHSIPWIRKRRGPSIYADSYAVYPLSFWIVEAATILSLNSVKI